MGSLASYHRKKKKKKITLLITMPLNFVKSATLTFTQLAM
jgi:hypothetical protein